MSPPVHFPSDPAYFGKCRSGPALSGNGSTMTTAVREGGHKEVGLCAHLPMTRGHPTIADWQRDSSCQRSNSSRKKVFLFDAANTCLNVCHTKKKFLTVVLNKYFFQKLSQSSLLGCHNDGKKLFLKHWSLTEKVLSKPSLGLNGCKEWQLMSIWSGVSMWIEFTAPPDTV